MNLQNFINLLKVVVGLMETLWTLSYFFNEMTCRLLDLKIHEFLLNKKIIKIVQEDLLMFSTTQNFIACLISVRL